MKICRECTKLSADSLITHKRYGICFDCADKKFSGTNARVVATFKGSEFGILPWILID